jgi:hypothetical protein
MEGISGKHATKEKREEFSAEKDTVALISQQHAYQYTIYL